MLTIAIPNKKGINRIGGRLSGATDSPIIAAAIPPINICPHPPILKNFILKGMPNAYVVKVRGINFFSVSINPNREEKERNNKVCKALGILYPSNPMRTAVIPKAMLIART